MMRYALLVLLLAAGCRTVYVMPPTSTPAPAAPTGGWTVRPAPTSPTPAPAPSVGDKMTMVHPMYPNLECDYEEVAELTWTISCRSLRPTPAGSFPRLGKGAKLRLSNEQEMPGHVCDLEELGELLWTLSCRRR